MLPSRGGLFVLLFAFLTTFSVCSAWILVRSRTVLQHHQLRIRSRKALISNLSSGLESAEEEDNTAKWERMYEQGAAAVQNPFKIEDGPPAISSSQIRVISFDLDNTLWKTGLTIDAANDALAEFLGERNIQTPRRVEKIMGDLFRESKRRYCPFDADRAKGPNNLTLLRKDALNRVLTEYNDYSSDESNDLVNEAFDVWMSARYEAIEESLAKGVVDSLEKICSLTTADGNPVIIIAITDGNSNPMEIPSLKKYFTLVVNAEQVGVSKPDRRVYVEALRELSRNDALKDVFKGCETDDQLEEVVGPWWVHIGDDFVKDVVAAKDLGARTIWTRELVLDKIKMSMESEAESDKTVEDLLKEVSSKSTIRMQVGASDYLIDAIHREFADAVVDEFCSLSQLLRSWHEEGIATIPNEIYHQAFDQKSYESPNLPSEGFETNGNTVATNSKFCMACGNKLPVEAKFCSSCGQTQ